MICLTLSGPTIEDNLLDLEANKDFVDILPGETATRNQSILELTGLDDRILRDYGDFSFIDRHIDYDKVNDIIGRKRVESLDYLSQSLKN